MSTERAVTIDLEDCHVLALERSVKFYTGCWKSATSYLDPEPTKSLSTHVFNAVLTKLNQLRTEKRVLSWQPLEDNMYYPLVAYYGNYPGGDGVCFSIEHYATCYRRGPYKLVIDVASGPMQEAWGCFDEQDQPMRYFHKMSNAMDEAEQIARVLLQDRFNHGPINYERPTKTSH